MHDFISYKFSALIGHRWSKLFPVGDKTSLSYTFSMTSLLMSWTNADLLANWLVESSFNEVRIKKQKFSFMKMHLEMSSAKWRSFCRPRRRWILAFNVRGPSHDIDYVEYVRPGLTWGRILSTCFISMWSNDIKCKYMFMFPLQNLARKGLILTCTLWSCACTS